MASDLIETRSARSGSTPFSHLETVDCITPMASANCAWVILKTFLRMCLIAFIDAHNMRIWINCKPNFMRKQILMVRCG